MSTIRITASDWLIYIAITLIWGSSFILIHKGLEYFPPVIVAALRITIAGIALAPFSIRGLLTLDLRSKFYSVIMGLCASGVPAFLYATGQTHVTSGIAGILNSLTPIFIILTGWLFFKQKYSWLKSSGIFLGFIGTVALIFFTHRSSGAGENSYFYGFLIVIATFLYGLSNQILTKFLMGKPSIVIMPFSFIVMGAFTAIILFNTDFIHIMKTEPDAWKGLVYVSILSVFGSALAMVLYTHLAHRTGVAFSGTVTYLMPIVSIGWSFTAGEYIGVEHFLSMGLILLGVYLVRKN